MTILLLFNLVFRKNHNNPLKYIFLVLIAMLVSYNATSQVTADFTTITSTSGCGSLVVEFEDLSLGNPTSWLWDFGNGNTSILKNPIAIYNQPGIYDVTLTVFDASNNDIKVKHNFIKVHEEPIAVLQANSVIEGCIPLNTTFQDLSTSSMPIVSWQWDFGDGGSSFVQNPSYNYLNNGVFSVSLSIIDANGCQDLVTEIDIVTANKVPVVDFTSDIMFSCNQSELVTFTNNSMFASSYNWIFGNGNTSTNVNPTNIYNAGSYSVKLIAKEGNCSDSLIYTDYIKIGESLTPDFITDTNSGCAGININFTNLTNNNADTWLWNFGDGATSTNQNPSHIYANHGSFDITLTASISGQCETSLIFPSEINIFEKPEINFIADTTYSCSTPFNVEFTDNTNNIINWLWDFGDGQTSNLNHPVHSYLNFGSYDISLTVENLDGCSSSLSEVNFIEVDKIITGISASSVEGCAPHTINFTDTTTSSRQLIDWKWDFGDGNLSNMQNPSNIYLNTGIFDVSLMVTNDYGCVSSLTVSDYIKIDESPLVNFIATPIVSCAGSDINFSNLSSLGTNNWQWRFGDGSYSNIENPIYQYSFSGIYDVSLIAGVNSCRDSLVIEDYIKIIEPTAIFEEEYNCENPLSVNFINLSIGADLISWDFGDGVTSIQSNPTHVFNSFGTHNISLSVTNNLTGCTHEFIKQIKLTDPIANFDYLVNPTNGYEDSVGCAPKQVFIDNQSQDCDYYKVLWSDGHIGYGREDHTFTMQGNFDVTLIITDIHGCKDTMTIEDMYHIYDITVDFGISNVLGCDSMFVEFTDFTTPSSSHLFWDFGDGGNAIINNPDYIYYNEGNYDVTVFGESTEGCKDTLKRVEYIKFQYPQANFSVSDQGVCPGNNILFSNLSNGIGISSIWDFGDGTQSTLINPTHQFNSNGIYDINLMITDSFGCSNILTLTNHINVKKPTADFITPGLSSNCPPLISDFINLSSADATLFTWNFSDGGSSIIKDPTHLFTTSGVFDVSLIVENSFGCKDTLLKSALINISGPIGDFTISDSLICKNDVVNFIPNLINTSSYLWDFGNGILSTDSLPTYQYTISGDFIPTLIAESDSGCQLTITLTDTIKVKEVIIDAGLDTEICSGESIQFNATGSSTQFIWSPANTLSNANISNPIATPIDDLFYFVYHTDGMCDAIDSIFVNVHTEIPIANFTTNNHCEGDVTSFLANSGLTTTNISYNWSFGQNGQNVNSSLDLGDNSIVLTVQNMDNNCADTLVKNIKIFPLPIADFFTTEACLGEQIIFTDNSSINTVEWSYNFADGTGVSNNQNPSYIYPIPGIYNVILNVISDQGCKNSANKNVFVHELPTVDFTVESHCENEGNIFTDLSSILNGEISEILYDFNDGNTSSDSISSHVFLGSGLFDVDLTAITKNGCESTVTKTTEVYANPIVDFTISQFCFRDQTIFHDHSFVENSHIKDWNWIFGLENSSTDNNTVYTFENYGTHYVSLSVISDRGCEAIRGKKIVINKLPKPNFQIPSNTCLGDEIKITDLSNGNGSEIIAWNYNFGDGNSSNEQNPTHTYNNIGEFDISLEITSSIGCIKDTIMQAMIVIHPLPTADFQASTLIASELESEIHFYNKSDGAISYIWNFDNGDYSIEENPTYEFRNTQDYNVSLIAENSFGCQSEMVKIVNIHSEFSIFIPDAFTPNGDGINDVFEVKGDGIEEFKMQVFDRWGGIIFESTNIALGWDGYNSLNSLTDNGIYLYNISLYDLNGRLWVYNGELNLMR